MHAVKPAQRNGDSQSGSSRLPTSGLSSERAYRSGPSKKGAAEKLSPHKRAVKLHMTMSRFLRILWASPCSLVGLALGAVVLLFGGSVRRVGCALEFAFYSGPAPSTSRLRRLHFSAITFGHV